MVRAWLLSLTLLLVALPASAQSSAAAQTLFDEGVALRDRGDLSGACAKFAESLRLEPLPGTRFNLADCYQREGKLSSAWSHFLHVAADTERSGDAARAKVARQRAEDLEPRLAKMVVKPSAPVPGLTVKRNGAVVGEPQWNTAVPVDTGVYLLEVSAPGKKTWSQQVTVSAEGSVTTVNIPALEDAPVPAPLGLLGDPVGDEPEPGTPVGMITGISLGVVGLVGVGLGIGFGLSAIAKKDEVDELCPDLERCTVDGIARNDEARTAATISTVGFIAGGVVLATGVALWIALPDGSVDDAALRLSPGGVTLYARF